MKSIDKRIALFTLLCIPARVLLVNVTKKSTIDKRILAGFLLAISAGFMYIYLSGSRTTGAETFGAKIWWNSLRPIHSLLYLLAAYLVYTKSDKSHLPLVLDVTIGFISFLYIHFVSK